MKTGAKLKVLVIAHEASLTGAPILLLHLLSLVKINDWFDFEIVLKRGGVLTLNYVELAQTLVLKDSDYQKNKSFAASC